MELLLTCFRSRVAILGVSLYGLVACHSAPEYYQHELTASEQVQRARELEGGMVKRHYQGSPAEQMTLREALALDASNADLHRENGIAHLKRGMLSDWPHGYDKAIELDPVNWQGWRGYLHLYFHRDYERALRDFDELDPLTPNFTDYPQSTSIHYMRGVCLMQLGRYREALNYFDRWHAEETAHVEERYLGAPIWQYRAVCYDALGQADSAEMAVRHGLDVLSGESAELWYYLAERVRATRPEEACVMLGRAMLNLRKGYSFSRPYVEEFYEVDAYTIRQRQAEWCSPMLEE